MNDLRAAAQQALEALIAVTTRTCAGTDGMDITPINDAFDMADTAISDLRTELAKPQPEPEHGVAHHGPPILTRRDEAICLAMAEWIRIARARNGKDWLPGSPDIVKSRLFWRLRSGKPALPSPPPTAYSCPWYELIDEPERPHWTFDMGEWNGETFFAQCRYEVLARNEAGKPSRVKFGPYEFCCWHGKAPHGDFEGWWLQYEPAGKAAAA